MKKILVIEDDQSIQDIYQKKLNAESFEVIQATTGEQGLQAVKKDGVDLILLDIMLPGGINGFDVLEQLKIDDNYKNIPVLVLTNLDTEEKTARDIGAADYIVKANTPIGKVIDKVKQYLK